MFYFLGDGSQNKSSDKKYEVFLSQDSFFPGHSLVSACFHEAH